MGSTPSHAQYEEMKDTPWIKQARQIADIGGQGILDNYNKVNTFDEDTKASLEARNNDTYKRAFDNMNREYANTMNKYNAANYNQFGTLNATPAAYRTDMYNLQAQRQLDDLAYNQAMNYDTLMNNELQRRYNTLNMFSDMYGYGTTPYQQDVANWNTRNTNKDIDYMNNMTAYQNSFGNKFGSTIGSVVGGIAGSTLGPIGTSVGSTLGSGIGGII